MSILAFRHVFGCVLMVVNRLRPAAVCERAQRSVEWWNVGLPHECPPADQGSCLKCGVTQYARGEAVSSDWLFDGDSSAATAPECVVEDGKHLETCGCGCGQQVWKAGPPKSPVASASAAVEDASVTGDAPRSPVTEVFHDCRQRDTDYWPGAPGDTHTCSVWGITWVAEEFGPLDIKWVRKTSPAAEVVARWVGADRPVAAAAGDLTWHGWAVPAILEVLASYVPLVHIRRREEMADRIADRIACDPARAIEALQQNNFWPDELSRPRIRCEHCQQPIEQARSGRWVHTRNLQGECVVIPDYPPTVATPERGDS